MSIVETVNKKIDDIISKRKADIEQISEKMAEADAAIAEQTEIIKKATEILDAESYAAAKAKTEMLKTKREMFADRLKMIRAKELVTEEESEKIISDLLAYEKSLEAEYEKELSRVFRELQSITNKQFSAAAEAENALNRWTREVRPNYISPNTVYPDGTHKSKTPVPVHRLGYFGGDTAKEVDNILKLGFVSNLIS